MKLTITTALLLAFSLWAGAQDKGDLAACLRAVLETPEVNAPLKTGWAGQEQIYLRHSSHTAANPPLFTRLFEQLQAEDLEGLTYKFSLVEPGEAAYLPSESRDSGIIEVGGGFRGGRMVLTLFAWHPNDVRQQLNRSFILEQRNEQWELAQ